MGGEYLSSLSNWLVCYAHSVHVYIHVHCSVWGSVGGGAGGRGVGEYSEQDLARSQSTPLCVCM